MKTYKIELSNEVLKEGCLTQYGVLSEYAACINVVPNDGRNIPVNDLKRLKCIEVEYFYPDIAQFKEITDLIELQKIWEAIKGEEPKKEWRLAHLEWQNFTLKEGTYEVDFEDNILPEEITCMNELMHGEVLPDNNGWISIKVEWQDHHTVVLKNKRGDTFTFNPLKYENLADFLH